MDKKLFMVSKKPLVLWGDNLDRANRNYLDDIDGDYFFSVAETLYAKAKGRGLSSKRARLALRFLYLNSLETFFALLSASIQAPDCVMGWLMKYQVNDVRAILRAINNNEQMFNKWNLDTVNWENVFQALFPFSRKISHYERIETAFCTAWKILNSDFLKEISQREYNSIKHGFRCCFNPIRSLSITSEGNSFNLRGSRSGSAFPVESEIVGLEKEFAKCNFTYSTVYNSWQPHKLLSRIKLISISINNVANALKRVNHQGKLKISFLWPEPPLLMAAFRRDRSQFRNFKTGLEMRSVHIKPMTASEIGEVLCKG